MLTVAHNHALASRTDSLQIVRMHGESSKDLEEIVVSGSWVPISLAESAHRVEVLTRQDIENAQAQSVNDLLKLCSSVDVRQRGGMGIQTDIGIGGGTFDQVSILLNGISINNPQTGHLTADFPVSMDDIERIEIYDGASARFFGSQALNGAINIITRKQTPTSLSLHAQAGSYGTAGSGFSGATKSAHGGHQLSGAYLRTDGATENSDLQRLKAYYHGHHDDGFLLSEWQLGYSQQRYGANTFYSANYPNQWERNNRLTASFGGHTQKGRIRMSPRLAWVRSLDHFQLIRHTHTAENFHRNDVFTAGLSAHTRWAAGQTAWGGEVRHEGILSTNLGKPLAASQQVRVAGHDSIFYDKRTDRTNVSLFLEHSVKIGAFSLGGGIMGNRNSAVDEKIRLYPGLDLRLRPWPTLSLYASWNKSMRLPTFTDLYYKSPTQEGNTGLRPETMSTFKLCADYTQGWLEASLQGILRRGTDMIDWVMYDANDIYHSTQFRLNNYEVCAQAKANLQQLLGAHQPLRGLDISYTHIYQKRHDLTVIYKSNYALEYLRHKFNLSLHHHICRNVEASWYWMWQDRMGGYILQDAHGNSILKNYSPYSILNMKVRWQHPRYTLSLSAENLTNHTYYDFGSIPQPGLMLLVGVKWHCP